jgi:glycosyltransferase involved in cell wall biosynthesis
MSKVSIIIPSRGEKPENLKRTLESIYENATGEFEVIVGFNGRPYQDLLFYKNLRVFESPENIGLKPMLNKLARMATGEYIYKSDAHCSFGKGFDEILQSNMEDDWVVTPRFYVLDFITWDWQDNRFYDYFYLSCPFTDRKGLRFKAGGHWPERTKERLESHPYVDETPSMHGSGWFVNRKYFLDVLGGFPESDWDGHAQEPIWLGLKNWLMGGKLMVNKKTWYAHLHQQSNQRGYLEDRAHTEKTYNETASYWLLNEESNLKHNFEWFVDKFYPIPTWPENWEELYTQWKEKN